MRLRCCDRGDRRTAPGEEVEKNCGKEVLTRRSDSDKIIENDGCRNVRKYLFLCSLSGTVDSASMKVNRQIF